MRVVSMPHPLEGIDPEDLGREAAQAFVEEDRARKTYFNSPEFKKKLDTIRKHSYIDHTRLKYRLDTIEGLAARDFGKVCDAVFCVLEKTRVRERGADFPTFHIDYEGIRFHVSMEQGSAYWTTTSQR